MTGTVVRMRRRGVEAQMDQPLSGLDWSARFQIVRGAQVLGELLPWKISDDKLRLNYADPTQVGIQVGDQVRSE